MDDKKKEQLSGGAIGGVIEGLIAGPAGAAGGATLGSLLFGSESDHKDVLRDTFYEVKEATSESANLYVHHIDPSGAEASSPEGIIDNVDGIPDLISIDSTSSNLIVEAETMEGIADDEQHALKQLRDFRTRGFKRVLVVPEDEIDLAVEWVEEHEERGNIEGSLTLSSPERINNVLQ
ncbi:hypothetical protein [Halorussus salinus]|uniref:hypothetical protein n=1 Tax=Halorussus salinus TaxID=1364935 RepID=UPI001092F349|nr:hypothetical protein [Halorussus salinus]